MPTDRESRRQSLLAVDASSLSGMIDRLELLKSLPIGGPSGRAALDVIDTAKFGIRRRDHDPSVGPFREGIDGQLAQILRTDESVEVIRVFPRVGKVFVDGVANDGEVFLQGGRFGAIHGA